jgi:carbonic anhydrase/acetyltransferase-like protein (isoleucine patch superfamily)
MKHLENLIERIIRQVNVHLRKFDFDVMPFLKTIIPSRQFLKFYGFYGISSQHPISFHFSKSSLSGSYFLGRCRIDNSILYKSDIRGDELKSKGGIMTYQGIDIPIEHDEVIGIEDSLLIKNLVHSFSHDPEKPEELSIKSTASMHYANIHGSQTAGCLIGPFSTVDLTSLRNCIVGSFSYLQVGELSDEWIKDGVIWVKKDDLFDFKYTFPSDVIEKYVNFKPGKPPAGILMEFMEKREMDFQELYDVVHIKPSFPVPAGASINRYSVLKGKNNISKNVLVAQRAYLENAWLGKGANVQENCYIIKSRMEGLNVNAHGAKISNSLIGKKVFVGFNSFLRRMPACPLIIGQNSIVMPHSIIDIEEPVSIPPDTLVWGHITRQKDIINQSISLKDFSSIRNERMIGSMQFRGNGAEFVRAFQKRIEHILEANGAYFDGKKGKGHAQKAQNIAFNIIQPYPVGPMKGLYPTTDINP